MKKSLKLISVFAILTCVIMVFAACGNNVGTSDDDTTSKETTQSETEKTTEKEDTSKEDDSMANQKVNVKMKNGGEFVIELYPEFAPETVANFVKLVSEGFYDGLIFHRVVDGFMAQGGDPDGTGMGGSKDTIKGEFASNGFKQNTLSHTRGVLSMARSQMKDSASSQFFICFSDYCSQLDGDYAAFGKVIDGMEVVDAFCDVERKYNSMGEKASPVEPIIIETMTLAD